MMRVALNAVWWIKRGYVAWILEGSLNKCLDETLIVATNCAGIGSFNTFNTIISLCVQLHVLFQYENYYKEHFKHCSNYQINVLAYPL